MRTHSIALRIKAFHSNGYTPFLLISLLVWIYLWIKAALSPLYFDEITTFYVYVQPNHFLPYDSQMEANNHFLNSALTTFFYDIFGSSEISLRLANLLFFPFYCWFVIKITTFLSWRLAKWMFFLSMVLALNFVDYFSVCRGYGMSMGLLVSTLYFLIQYLKTGKNRFAIYSLLAGMMSVCANLTLLGSFALLTGMLLLIFLMRLRGNSIRQNVYLVSGIALFGFVPLLFFGNYTLEMSKAGYLHLGQVGSFYNTTILSVTDNYSGMVSAFEYPYAVALFFLSALFLIFLILKNGVSSFMKEWNAIYYLLAGNVVLILLLKEFLNINYPIYRAGIFLIPLFLVSVFTLFDRMSAHLKTQTLMISFLPLMYVPVDSLRNINFTHTNVFSYEVYVPKRFFDQICLEQKKAGVRYIIGGEEPRKWYFLNYKSPEKLDVINHWNYPNNLEDFQIIGKRDLSYWAKDYQVIDSVSETTSYLLKRKNFAKRVFLCKKKIEDPVITRNEYLNLFEISLDSNKIKNIYAKLEFSILSKSTPCVTSMVMQVNDKKDQMIRYSFINLNWLYRKFDKNSGRICNGIYIDKIPENAAKVIVYIWNPKFREYSFSGTCQFYTLTDL